KKRYLSGNRKMTHKSAAVCALVLGLAFALSGVVAARAQNITASVRGTVTDKQGAAIAGAEVTITNNDTGYSRVSISSADGAYSFESLPIGKYRLRATKAGFRSFSLRDVELHVADNLTLDAQLDVGAATETIEVIATANQVELANGELSGTIAGAQITQLPLNGR